jgi:hypothetical protein
MFNERCLCEDDLPDEIYAEIPDRDLLWRRSPDLDDDRLCEEILRILYPRPTARPDAWTPPMGRVREAPPPDLYVVEPARVPGQRLLNIERQAVF